MKYKRKLSLTLCICILLCGSLFSCGGDVTNDTEAENTTTADVTTQAQSNNVIDYSNRKSPLSVDGIEISFEKFRYYFMSVKYQYDSGNDDFWKTNDYTDRIKDEAVAYLRSELAVDTLAKKYNISLTDNEIQSSKDEAHSLIFSSYTSEADFQKEMFCSENLYTEFCLKNKLCEKLTEYLISDESGNVISSDLKKVRTYIDNYIIRANHILILNDETDDLQANKALAEKLHQKILNGEDFDKIKEEYSEDEQTNASDIGYYFTKGDIGEEFENAAFALDEGEVSDVVVAVYGFHIIKRLPLDMDYIRNNLESEFLPFYQKKIFSIILDEEKELQNVVYNDSFADITIGNIG